MAITLETKLIPPAWFPKVLQREPLSVRRALVISGVILAGFLVLLIGARLLNRPSVPSVTEESLARIFAADLSVRLDRPIDIQVSKGSLTQQAYEDVVRDLTKIARARIPKGDLVFRAAWSEPPALVEHVVQNKVPGWIYTGRLQISTATAVSAAGEGDAKKKPIGRDQFFVDAEYVVVQLGAGAYAIAAATIKPVIGP